MSTLDAATVKTLLSRGVPIPEDIIASIDGMPRQHLHDAMAYHHRLKDTLRGYKPLDTWFMSHTPEPGTHPNTGRGPWQPWNQMFEESGLAGKYTHVLLVADIWMYGGRNGGFVFPLTPPEKDRYGGKNLSAPGFRQGRMRVYLSRKHEFIVWASWPECVFRERLGIDTVVSAVHELTSKGVQLRERHAKSLNKMDEQLEVTHPALTICRGIIRAIEASAKAKREDSELEEETAKSLKKKTGLYVPAPSAT
jgi:hypothetical protein